MSVRLRRFKADYNKMRSAFTEKSRIRILKTIGSPPEKYQIEFLVSSLTKDLTTQRIRAHNSFIAEIFLTSSYPRMAPQCKMLTPVFHPNIAPHAICIGDHWAAGESLSNLVVRIAEMLAFQSYNVKSPLNGEAAKWVDKNRDRLPLDSFDFSSLLSTGEAVRRDSVFTKETQCANCGRKAVVRENFAVCMDQHITCPECLIECSICKGIQCMACTLNKCAICKKNICYKCICKCNLCNQGACKGHIAVCHVDKQLRCHDCLVNCSICGKVTCVEHIKKSVVEGQRKYICTNCNLNPGGRHGVQQ